MKRVKLFFFPLLFVIALAGSAFTRHTASTAAQFITAYYADNFWGTCNSVVLSDGKCVKDNLNYTCKEYVSGYGTTDMWQYSVGNTCYQPYYSYTP